MALEAGRKEGVRKNGLVGIQRVENSHEPVQSFEGENPAEGHNRHHNEGEIPPIPNGVPDSWMDLLGGDDDALIPPDLDGPESVCPDHLDVEEDLEHERPAHLEDNDPDLPPHTDDFCEEGRSAGAP